MDSTQLAVLKQQDEANIYFAHGDVIKADCIIGFSFGYVGADKYQKPGKSKEQLAAFIEERFPTTPLILQFEISDALKTSKAAHIIRKSRQEGEYLNSREIAEQAFIYMQENGWRSALIITHPAMEARNDALCSTLGIITVTPPGLEAIQYDTNSAQPWTRDKDSWWKREQDVIQTCLDNGWL